MVSSPGLVDALEGLGIVDTNTQRKALSDAHILVSMWLTLLACCVQ